MLTVLLTHYDKSEKLLYRALHSIEAFNLDYLLLNNSNQYYNIENEIKFHKNIGLKDALKIGCELAEFDYVMKLDSDDYLFDSPEILASITYQKDTKLSNSIYTIAPLNGTVISRAIYLEALRSCTFEMYEDLYCYGYFLKKGFKFTKAQKNWYYRDQDHPEPRMCNKYTKEEKTRIQLAIERSLDELF